MRVSGVTAGQTFMDWDFPEREWTAHQSVLSSEDRPASRIKPALQPCGRTRGLAGRGSHQRGSGQAHLPARPGNLGGWGHHTVPKTSGGGVGEARPLLRGQQGPPACPLLEAVAIHTSI